MTINSAATRVLPYARRDREALRTLIFANGRVHTHLDWQPLDDWLDSPDGAIMLAWEGARLIGAMGLSPQFNGAHWLRVLALSDDVDDADVIAAMWRALLAAPSASGLTMVAALIIRTWAIPTLTLLGFSFGEDIVTLERPRLPITAPPSAGLTIRLLHKPEIGAAAEVDQQAFAPPWQMTLAELRHAERVSSLGLVAQIDGQIVGYALCTMFIQGAHLARLGVLPTMQRRGVATALLAEAVLRYQRRGIYTMSVNTQASNARSLRLYERFGFARTGYDVPVWLYRPDAANG